MKITLLLISFLIQERTTTAPLKKVDDITRKSVLKHLNWDFGDPAENTTTADVLKRWVTATDVCGTCNVRKSWKACKWETMEDVKKPTSFAQKNGGIGLHVTGTVASDLTLDGGMLWIVGDLSGSVAVVGGGGVTIYVSGDVTGTITVKGNGRVCIGGSATGPLQVDGGSVHVAKDLRGAVTSGGNCKIHVGGDVDLSTPAKKAAADEAETKRVIDVASGSLWIGGSLRGTARGVRTVTVGGKLDPSSRLPLGGVGLWWFDELLESDYRKLQNSLGVLLDSDCSEIKDVDELGKKLKERLEWCQTVETERTKGTMGGATTRTEIIIGRSDLAPGLYECTDADWLPGSLQGHKEFLPHVRVWVLAKKK